MIAKLYNRQTLKDAIEAINEIIDHLNRAQEEPRMRRLIVEGEKVSINLQIPKLKEL